MKRTHVPQCSAEECERPVKAKGLCPRHYQQHRWAERSGATCKIRGCHRTVKARGLCGKHYAEERTKGLTCSVKDCGAAQYAKGFCSAHYMREWSTGDPGEAAPRRRPPRTCKADGCTKLTIGRDDLCANHHYYMQQWGNLLGRLCSECKAKAVQGADLCPEHFILQARRQIVSGERAGFRTSGGYIAHKVLRSNTFLEHRVIVEERLGRALYPFENVHHRNGKRADNRPENLELWTKPQPQGQRPEDLVAWVVEFYPDLVAAELRAQR